MSLLARRHFNLIRREIELLGSQHSSENTNGNGAVAAYPIQQARAGDLFLGHCSVRTSSLTPSAPMSWDGTLFSDVDTGNFWRQCVAYKVATGSETPGGGETFVIAGLPTITAIKLTSIYLFRNVAAPVFHESGGVVNSSAGTIIPPTITPTVLNSLALFFHSEVSNSDISLISGNSGGIWAKASVGVGRNAGGNNLFQNMQMARIMDLGPVTGGSATVPTLTVGRGFSIKLA